MFQFQLITGRMPVPLDYLKFTETNTMGKKIFISYCHAQKDWVRDRLVPVLKAGKAEVLIDNEQFKAGKAVPKQMDATQNKADVNVLVLSPEYLKSKNCVHEMERAIKRDPRFKKGIIAPVVRKKCDMPDKITIPDPLYIDLCNAKDKTGIDQWKKLLDICEADIGTDAPAWLNARDEISRYLNRGDSVNLVVSGYPKWRGMVANISDEVSNKMGYVDLESGATMSRKGLVTEILKSFGINTCAPDEPNDLVELHNEISKLNNVILTFAHFDNVTRPQYNNADLFDALRHLIETRKIALFAVSRKLFAALLPKDHHLSHIEIKTVELKGSK